MSDEDHIEIIFKFLDRDGRGRISALELIQRCKEVNHAVSANGLARVSWSTDRFRLDSFVFWSAQECRWFFRGGGLGDPLSSRKSIQQTDVANAVRAHRKFLEALSASARLERWLHRLLLEAAASVSDL
jgi:hypothetical protein